MLRHEVDIGHIAVELYIPVEEQAENSQKRNKAYQPFTVFV